MRPGIYTKKQFEYPNSKYLDVSTKYQYPQPRQSASAESSNPIEIGPTRRSLADTQNTKMFKGPRLYDTDGNRKTQTV